MDFELILFILLGLFAPLAFPLFSWAIGRWYQGTLLNALNEQEISTSPYKHCCWSVHRADVLHVG